MRDDAHSTPDLKHLFEPRGIAVIGASRENAKIGYKVVENIVCGGYKGNVYPVNPKGGEILGRTVCKTLEEINGAIDVAVIAIPAKLVFEAVKACAAKRVKFLVIITSGFSEVGDIAAEKQIVNYANENGMRVLGPNIFGIYSATASLNATFGPRDITPGSVSIVTQSGALGIAMIGKTQCENIGLSSIISVGNKSDIDESDILEYLINHKETKTVLMYIEGTKGGERLVETLKRMTKKKPVIVIKSGRSKRGAMAAASHTGSLAGSDDVFSAIMRQCGVIRAETIQDALNWCKFLSATPVPKGEQCVIVTNGGGIGVMAADACEKHGVNLYDDIQALKEMFREVVPDFGSVKNPVDITGQAGVAEYEKALRAALKNGGIHSVICLCCESATFDIGKFANAVEGLMPEYNAKKPIVFSLIGGVRTNECIARLRAKGVPMFSDVYEAVSCMGTIYANYRNRIKEEEQAYDWDVDADAVGSIIKNARAEGRPFLLAPEAQAIMELVGVAMPKSMMAYSIDEAVKCAEEIGYPVVMKVVSKDILHKSDVGGVALDLQNKSEVIDAYQAILYNCRNHNPGAHIEGVEVSEMIKKGTEMIVGARRDSSFGPVVMFGLGGIYVEVMKDVAFRSFPLGRKEAMKMIGEIRSYPLLLGVRGEKKKDINTVAEILLRVATIIRKCKQISDIEINPLIVYDEGAGAKAVDARILLSKAEGRIEE